MTVAAAAPCQRIDAVLEIEMVNQARLAQALGYLFGLFVLSFKRTDQVQPNKVGHFDLNRHRATVGRAGVAHARFVAGPAFWAINVNDADGRFHAGDFMCCLDGAARKFCCRLGRAGKPNKACLRGLL